MHMPLCMYGLLVLSFVRERHRWRHRWLTRGDCTLALTSTSTKQLREGTACGRTDPSLAGAPGWDEDDLRRGDGAGGVSTSTLPPTSSTWIAIGSLVHSVSRCYHSYLPASFFLTPRSLSSLLSPLSSLPPLPSLPPPLSFCVQRIDMICWMTVCVCYWSVLEGADSL
jgi:hypothetical protein